jgi:hypothetical protein
LIFGAINNIDKKTIGQAVKNDDSHIFIKTASSALCKKLIAPDTINAVLNDIRTANNKFLYFADIVTKVADLFREIVRLLGHLYPVSPNKVKSYSYLPLPLAH